MARGKQFLAVALVALSLVGCGSFPVAEGLSREQVLSEHGKPTAELTRGTTTRMQYSGQPFGQFAWMVDLEPTGRVARSYQALTLNEFSRIDISGTTTTDDILWAYGRPASVDHVSSWQGDVWTYRWNNGWDMFFWIYFDPAGIVRRTQQGQDMLNVPERR
ncbi:hypothetical protein [Variovorax sp. HJSM1_2]|uniref:hypothetical protein n=1 Tax=Variovorax sp. HJSM1_2 TaxID=3366263 RepID=UPI003BE86B1A